MISIPQVDYLFEDLEIAHWSIQLFSKQIHYSSYFETLFGEMEEDKTAFEDFLTNILHPDFRYDFRVFFDKVIASREASNIEIKLKTKDSYYCWFECRSLKIQKEISLLIFTNIDQKKKDFCRLEENAFYFQEISRMNCAGGWYINIIEQTISWNAMALRLMDCPKNYQPKFKEHLEYYAPQHQDLIRTAFKKCENFGIPFQLELKMLSLNNREFWAKISGKPVYNDEQECIGMRGIFQDIDHCKTNEINLQNAINLISSQDARLFNFSHVVSHSLRRHSSNLSLVAQMLKEAKDSKDKLDLLVNIEDISKKLEHSIMGLNTLVSPKHHLSKIRKTIHFEASLKRVLGSISSLINRENAKIVSDFHDLKEINYIPEYLESIFLILVTNAVRFKKPGRKPVIYLKSYQNKQGQFLEISDNGLGIDLEECGDQLFGMYKTFHEHPEAKGTGLFIAKNQVESLGGKISVSSTVDIGTIFTIKF